MAKYELTVAMATFDDFYGVFSTVQALRMYHDMQGVEVIVLDNNPGSIHGKETASFCKGANTAAMPIRYETFEESQGTTQTRQKLFDLAEGEAVLVTDCHVMFQQNAIQNLKTWYANIRGTEQETYLFTGPLVYDTLGWTSTHFEPEWRDQMWGTWATAWLSPEGVYMVGRNRDGKLEMKVLNTEGPWMASGIDFPRHEDALLAKGFVPAANTESPFEVPAQGLGIFSSRKDHWLGFNPHFRHFGGEECYIHEKYRQAGRKTLCLPWLKWNHRFGRPEGPKYPITVAGKLRNYILGFTELGLSLDPVRQHFVDEIKAIPAEMYEAMVANPVDFDVYNNNWTRPNTAPQNMKPQAMSAQGRPLPMETDSLSMIAVEVATYERDLNQHASKLFELAMDSDSAVEVTKRRESTAFLLGGLSRRRTCGDSECVSSGCKGTCKTPVRFTSFQEEEDTLFEALRYAMSKPQGRSVTWDFKATDLTEMPVIEEDYDLLFIDTRHNGDRLAAELDAYSPRIGKYIVIHDTHIYGEKGDDGGKGLLFAIRNFLAANEDWYILYHPHEQYGLTVLSKVPEKRPEAPIKPWLPMTAAGLRCGPGTQLKRYLKRLGIEATANCSCNARAAQMDLWGPAKCRENIETILDWLKEESDKRGMGYLYVRDVVRIMVNSAIRAAEKAAKSDRCF